MTSLRDRPDLEGPGNELPKQGTRIRTFRRGPLVDRVPRKYVRSVYFVETFPVLTLALTESSWLSPLLYTYCVPTALPGTCATDS